MEFINKNDLLATINEVYERKYAKCKFKPVQDVYNMIVRRINRAQVINVNDIVHCKECKYWEPTGIDPITNYDLGECHCYQWNNRHLDEYPEEYPETEARDYCSFGKRED